MHKSTELEIAMQAAATSCVGVLTSIVRHLPYGLEPTGAKYLRNYDHAAHLLDVELGLSTECGERVAA